jgi:hypothetical protein
MPRFEKYRKNPDLRRDLLASVNSSELYMMDRYREIKK